MPAQTAILLNGLYYYPAAPSPQGWKSRATVWFSGYPAPLTDGDAQPEAQDARRVILSGDDIARLLADEQMDRDEALCRIALRRPRFKGGTLYPQEDGTKDV